MLQQILQDMSIDPDILEALNDEQKKILFAKMREEQVRRWKEREEKLEREASTRARPATHKAINSKNVSWLLNRDGDVQTFVIGEMDELRMSQVIFSGLGGRKPSSLRNNMRLQAEAAKSNVVRRTYSEPVRTGRENLPPRIQTGMLLKLKDKGEEPKPGLHAPSQQIQVTEKDQRSTTAEREPCRDTNAGNQLDDSEDLDLSNQSHLKLRALPTVRGKLDTPGPPERHIVSCSTKARLCSQDSLEQHRVKGKAFRLVAASCRAGGVSIEDPGVAQGRVAQLTKNFSEFDTKQAPPFSKPPVPNKPSHLQLTSPSLR